MATVGVPAPKFDCTAVVERQVRELSWDQLHESKILALMFDSLLFGSDWAPFFAAVRQQAEQLERWHAKIALVCRDELGDIMIWLQRCSEESESAEPCIPIVVDSDYQIASEYDLLGADGSPRWGQILIDPRGIVRKTAVSAVPLETPAEEIIESVKGIWGPCDDRGRPSSDRHEWNELWY